MTPPDRDQQGGRFKKKQVEVEAIQWTGENREAIEEFVGDQAGSVTFDDAGRALTWMGTADPNAYFLRGPGESFTVLSSGRFEETYEPISDHQVGKAVEELAKRLFAGVYDERQATWDGTSDEARDAFRAKTSATAASPSRATWTS